MKVVAARSGSVEDFVLSEMTKYAGVDLLIFGFGLVKPVNFAEELRVENGIFYDIALLSENLKCVVAVACETELYGTMRKSVLMFENGKVLGVSDMNNTPADGNYLPGFGYRVYDTKKGSIGVVVDGDVMFRDGFETVSRACGDYALAVLGSEDTEETDTMIRSGAIGNGISVIAVSKSSFFCVNVMGKISERRNCAVSELEFKPQCVYNEILCKCKGIVL